MQVNGLKSRLAAGDTALVATLQLARSGDSARVFARAGYDALVLDAEHNLIGPDAMGEILLAALDAGIAPLVRLPDAAPGPIGQALSAGALGVVIPRVETADLAEAVARAAAFAPRGRRPLPPVFPHFRRVPTAQAEAVASLAAETLVVVIIETRQAVANAAAIAAVEGVDVLFLGASDLSADLGRPGAKDDPALWDAAAAVAAACRAAGKVPGMGGIVEDAHFARARALGMRWISAAHDATLLQAAATERAKRLRAL
ncbi:aldolase/citrate lyase family protein [Falsiroseomonas oryzae]|uniref:aldolase/citrate lyase family protein n=1 Tax=Falsiroseomonas oryzae TaxID=2766473 RepID=UPI0022EB1433|nr:aldolase/citrate lyase family protein [Roseomonas sp. MO-31]